VWCRNRHRPSRRTLACPRALARANDHCHSTQGSFSLASIRVDRFMLRMMRRWTASGLVGQFSRADPAQFSRALKWLIRGRGVMPSYVGRHFSSGALQRISRRRQGRCPSSALGIERESSHHRRSGRGSCASDRILVHGGLRTRGQVDDEGTHREARAQAEHQSEDRAR
jgi:hypothetical protein